MDAGGAAGVDPPCGSELALDAAVEAGGGAGSVGPASPSEDFGAGVTAGTGSARSGTSTLAPSPFEASSLGIPTFRLRILLQVYSLRPCLRSDSPPLKPRPLRPRPWARRSWTRRSWGHRFWAAPRPACRA